MSSSGTGRRREPPAEAPYPDIGFDGYPYLVTKIGTRSLRHLMVLPADRGRDELVELASRQAAANRLPTALVLGQDDAVEVTADEPVGLETILWSGRVPRTDKLQPVGRFRPTREYTRRRGELRAWVAEDLLFVRNFNYWGTDPIARVATSEERRLNRPRRDVAYPGLATCPACGGRRGQVLTFRTHTARTRTGIVDVYCPCQNHNRCAACGEGLNLYRLDAHHWSEDHDGPCYVRANIGLQHRCPRRPRSGQRLGPRS